MGNRYPGWDASTWRISTILLIAILLAVPAFAGESWPQWGGPDRNFTVKAQEVLQRGRRGDLVTSSTRTWTILL